MNDIRDSQSIIIKIGVRLLVSKDILERMEYGGTKSSVSRKTDLFRGMNKCTC